MASKVAFTDRRLLKLPVPEQGEASYLDSKTVGLGIRVRSSGSRTFFWRRKIEGRAQRVTIGEFPRDVSSVDDARRIALDLNVRVAAGENPAAIRQAARQEPTVGDLFAYWLEYARRHKRTWKEDERLYGKFLKAWANRRISTITRREVEALHHRVGEHSGPYQANRLLSLVRAAWNKADRLEPPHRGDNPAKGVKRFPEESRDRFLDASELRRFFAALELEDVTFRDFYLMLLLTGARRGNVQAMAWKDVNLDLAVWRIPQTKSGQAVLVPLVPAVITVLESRRRLSNGSPWVFPSRGETGHIVEPKTAWARIIKRAGLEDVRPHDLRRTLGSWQAAAGASLPIIGRSLGHKPGSPVTAVYGRLSLDPIRASVTTATNAMLEAAQPENDDDDQP
jgi:integrase